MSSVVIVGASVAGVKLAQNLRAQGFTGSLTLLDEQSNPLYDKPPLSKEYLEGRSSRDDIGLSSHAELNSLNIEMRFGVAANSLDPVTRILTLDDGSALSYSTLVIATGARARRTPWATLPNVHLLRTKSDADRLRADLTPGRHIAVVGAGFIGAEAAATARRMGLRVTIIEPSHVPMGRAMNSEIGTIFAQKHRQEGVEFRFGVLVDHAAHSANGLRLFLTDDSMLDVDVLLLGIGAIPNTEWLSTSGLTINDGVLCDATLATVGASHIYAIGDVARFMNEQSDKHMRLEHWTSATEQAFIVAHNIMHPEQQRRYIPTPYVWSDQYDWKIQIVGTTSCEQWKVIGHPADEQFSVVYGHPMRPVEGAITVSWPRASIEARRAVSMRATTNELIERVEALQRRHAASVSPPTYQEGTKRDDQR